MRIWRAPVAVAIALAQFGCFGHNSIILRRDAPQGTLDCGFAVLESITYTVAAVGLGLLAASTATGCNPSCTAVPVVVGISSVGFAAAGGYGWYQVSRCAPPSDYPNRDQADSDPPLQRSTAAGPYVASPRDRWSPP